MTSSWLLVLGHCSVSVRVTLPEEFDGEDESFDKLQQVAIEIVASDLNMGVEALTSCVRGSYPVDEFTEDWLEHCDD